MYSGKIAVPPGGGGIVNFKIIYLRNHNESFFVPVSVVIYVVRTTFFLQS
jgi:hypothetical protein